MRVLSVIHPPIFGGPQNTNIRIAPGLASRGIELEVLVPSIGEADESVARFEAAGIQVRRLPLSRLRRSFNPLRQAQFLASIPIQSRRIADVIRRSRFDVVLINGLANPHAAFAARSTGAAVAWQMLDVSAPAPYRRMMMKIVERYADSAMFTGGATQVAHTQGRSLPCPEFLYYPPVPMDTFQPNTAARRDVRQRLGIPLDAPVVGTVANLNPDKGIDVFVNAAQIIGAQRPDAYFVMVGARYDNHAAYIRGIESQINDGPVPAERFIFPGPATDVERWYAAFDLMLLTSHREGAPTTVIEAMGCGLPVVATDVGSVRELILEGVTGAIVPAGDAGAVADHAVAYLNGQTLRSKHGQAARERAVAKFGVERSVEIHAAALSAAVRHRRALQEQSPAARQS